jgi:hypothetical protein
MEKNFWGFTVEYIDRNKNIEADELAKGAARNTPLLADVFLQTISDASIKMIKPKPKVINNIHGEDWRAPIMAYLRHYHETDSAIEQTRMQERAQSYQIVNNELYKICISGPLLHCVSKTKGQQILSEVHTGVCGAHIGARTLATKTLWQCFYWLAMIDDAAKVVSTCEACQRFSRKMKAPAQPVQLITLSWPLQRWGIDIVRKLTPAQGNYTFTVVAVEYFTKWIKAKPSIKKFFWQNIICHYGMPRHITINNAKYFDNAIFKVFCHQIGMKVTFASVYYPQSNATVERANSLIFKAMKKILEGEKKGKWAEVMPTAVWSHNTTVSRATNFTPFQLMYGTEAMLPEEIKHRSLWMAIETVPCTNEAEEKDLLESNRLKVVANLEKYQEQTRAWRDPKVKAWEFDLGNLVLLRSPKTESTGKFEPKWIGPYVVTQKTRPDAYRLSDIEGKVLEHSWNAENLYRYYI